jgi:imidazolonepropionase
MEVDLLVCSASQLLTLASHGPKSGSAMSHLGLIQDGAVAVRGGQIVLVGPTAEVRAQVEAKEEFDAFGHVVMPGLVDPHTHLVFAGSRVDEFEMRLRGASYLEIMVGGGGIMSTVRATRKASLGELVEESGRRLDDLLAHGTTTAECKTGYGLSVDDELKMLTAIEELSCARALDVVPTFLGAHAVPEEYKERKDEYVQLVIDEMLPQVKGRARFCDVFCEKGAFDLEETRSVLARAKELGLGLKVHADEFGSLGGAHLAAELGAVSADHLVFTPEEDLKALARAGTMAVLLPGTTFGLGEGQYAPARRMIELGVPLALATDLNPGTCWCGSMPFIIALACRYMRLTPAEAVSASTINAAYAVGLGEKIGSLEPNKMADLIVLDTPDYRDLAYRFGGNLVTRVYKRGHLVWPRDN